MRNAILVLLAAAVLLLAGCTQPPPPVQPPVQQPAIPSQPPAQPPPALQQNASGGNGTANGTLAPPGNASCTVQFQKDASNIYYVMVKSAQAGDISVTCPNGKEGEKKGGLYFCTQLDVPSPAVAYQNGAECGRALFSQADRTVPSTPGKQSCSVLLSSSRITAGSTAAVTIKAYAPQDSSNLTYLCGNSEVSEKASGLVDTGKICRFDSPGTVEVYAKLNGAVCASALLTVFSSPKDCSVYGGNFTMDRGSYVYAATVAGRGYSSGDLLRYTCYGIPYGIAVGTLKNPTDFTTAIECRSASGPLGAPVKVTLGGDACGEMQIPLS